MGEVAAAEGARVAAGVSGLPLGGLLSSSAVWAKKQTWSVGLMAKCKQDGVRRLEERVTVT